MKIAAQRKISKERGERLRAYLKTLDSQRLARPSFRELGRMFGVSGEQARKDARG